MSSATERGLWAVTRIMRYLNARPDLKITFRRGEIALEAYCDASCFQSELKQISVKGYPIIIGGGVIVHDSKKQTMIA